MSDTQVLEILTGAIEIATKMAGPILAATLSVGVVISIIQTVTQIQEMTLTFVPKVLAVAAILLVGGNWMMREMVNWVTTLWNSIPSLT